MKRERALEVDLGCVGPPLPGVAGDGPAAKYARMVEGQAARALGREPPVIARHYARASFADLAIELLVEGRRVETRSLRLGRNDSEIIRLAMTTGDLPTLLGNVGQKIVLDAYASAAAATTVRRIALPRVFKNFRPHPVTRLDTLPSLLQTNEHGEFKHGSVNDDGESVSLLTFGRVVRFSRQMIVGDDAGALGALMATAGQRAAAVVNDAFFAACITAGSGLGPTLSDANPVFDAAHSNVVAGGVLNATTLGSARALVKNQVVGASGEELRLNTAARFLLVAPEAQTLAEELVAKLAPAQDGEDGERMTVLSDANLSSSSRFYCLAAPSVGSNYIVGQLAGSNGLPLVIERRDFNSDALDFRVTLDAAVAAVDWRFASTGAGA